MTAKQIVDMAVAHEGITLTELSARLGTSPQAFGQRLKVGKFSTDDWKQIAEALGAEPNVVSIRFKDGTVIQ